MSDYRSGIIGRARVKFGGAIKITVHGGIEHDEVRVAVSLSEVKEQIGVGEKIPDNIENYGTQVWLEFNNIISIDMLRDALDCVEEYIKTGGFQESRYPKAKSDNKK
jgi:hypothetical protein